MKTLLVIAAVAAVAFLGWRLASPDRTNWTRETQVSHTPPTTTQTDPAAVFQRAFWKRPTAEDHILHAERREWKDADGITRWQWFIEVKPSAGLVKHLITDNAFNLAPAGSPGQIEQPPAWFAAATQASRILRAPGGGMTLVFDAQANVLLATDSGGGFRKGASEPAKPVAQATAAPSRLPNSPPPKP